MAIASALVPLALTSCSSDLDDAITRGCDALDVMSETYLTGDRATFDEALNDGWSFGAAVELASDDGPDPAPDSLISLGLQGVKVYQIAAYEPPEKNSGDLVWKGSELSPADEATVERAMEACDAR